MPFSHWNKTTTADEVSSALSSHISNKTILITGVSPNSLGAEAAATIATQSPKLIILASRNLSKIQETITYIHTRAPGAAVQALELDLADFSSVRRAADEVTTTVDVLINNAALMATSYRTTKDGFEAQFGTAHLGHFLFTSLLLEAGKMARDGRIVNVASSAHMFGPVRWDDPGFKNGETYEKWLAYGQAKTANILYAKALAERGWASISLHPGEVLTNLIESLPAEEKADLIKRYPDMQTHQQGTATHIAAAFRPDLIPERNGAYMKYCQVDSPAEHATGKENAERLWKLSEEMVGQKFDI